MSTCERGIGKHKPCIVNMWNVIDMGYSESVFYIFHLLVNNGVFEYAIDRHIITCQPKVANHSCAVNFECKVINLNTYNKIIVYFVRRCGLFFLLLECCCKGIYRLLERV